MLPKLEERSDDELRINDGNNTESWTRHRIAELISSAGRNGRYKRWEGGPSVGYCFRNRGRDRKLDFRRDAFFPSESSTVSSPIASAADFGDTRPFPPPSRRTASLNGVILSRRPCLSVSPHSSRCAQSCLSFAFGGPCARLGRPYVSFPRGSHSRKSPLLGGLFVVGSSSNKGISKPRCCGLFRFRFWSAWAASSSADVR